MLIFCFISRTHPGEQDTFCSPTLLTPVWWGSHLHLFSVWGNQCSKPGQCTEILFWQLSERTQRKKNPEALTYLSCVDNFPSWTHIWVRYYFHASMSMSVCQQFFWPLQSSARLYVSPALLLVPYRPCLWCLCKCCRHIARWCYVVIFHSLTVNSSILNFLTGRGFYWLQILSHWSIKTIRVYKTLSRNGCIHL